MKIAIVYDNKIKKGIKVKGLKASWGFACIIETDKKIILFDTGWDGDVLTHNMQLLGFNPKSIDIIVISHNHWDHAGGIPTILNLNPIAKTYIPDSFSKRLKGEIKKRTKMNLVRGPIEIYPNIYTTGELDVPRGKTSAPIKEQSLVLYTAKGLLIITGCAHPGINNILNSVKHLGNIYGLIGGFHDFKEYDLLQEIELIVPTHCTENKRKIISLFSKSCMEGGVGFQIDIDIKE